VGRNKIATDLPVRLYGVDRAMIRDFVLQELKGNASFAAVFNNFISAAQGMLFIEVVVNATLHAIYYGDRRAKNSYLPTADLRSAISAICDTLGYKMRGAAAGVVDLDVVGLPSGPYVFDVVIPRGFKFIGDGKVFESTESKTVPAGSVALAGSIALCQGESKTRTFTGDGSANQRLVLADVTDSSGKYLAGGSVKVWVNGVEWDIVDFISFGAGEEVQVDYNATFPEIRGGDGVAGKVFPVGATVLVSYFVTDGERGYVAKERINAAASTLTVAGQVIPLAVLNSKAVGSMSGPETLTEARVAAPRWRRAGQAKVVADDIEAMAEAFSDAQYGVVARAKAFSARSASSDVAFQGMLSELRSSVSQPSSVITSEVAAITQLLLASKALVDGIRSDLSDIESAKGDISAERGQVDNSRSVLSTRLIDLTSHISSLQSHITSFTSAASIVKVNAIPLAALVSGTITGTGAPGDNALDPVTYAELALYSGLLAVNGVIVESQTAALGQDKNDLQGDASALGGLATALASSVTNITASENEIQVGKNSATVRADALEDAGGTVGKFVDIAAALVVAETANLGWSDDGELLAQSLYDHVDAILSHDCKANVVSLPVLSLNSEGYYAAPSVGLIARLESYMNDGKKAPSVFISVASREDSLVAATVEITGVLLPGYVREEVQDALVEVVSQVLKLREFGVSLYEKEIYDAIHDAGISGIGSALTVQITGPSQYLDSRGNLIIDSTRVVTKGNVSAILTLS